MTFPTKVIVTTTINPPTPALEEYADKENWILFVVGDKKTPHADYKHIDCLYYHPDAQERHWPEVSESIGWGSIQRRNLGFLEAHRMGAHVVATVDDDNIPYPGWGEQVHLGVEISTEVYDDPTGVFDPLSVTNHPELWHRGYPIQNVPHRDPQFKGRKIIVPKVQADLWDGDPDVDAMCRMTYAPNVRFRTPSRWTSSQLAPFNSQNTFIHGDVLPFYACFPYVGRMDDIWGSYLLQMIFPEIVVYAPASVYQDRNDHDLVSDLEKEMIGYRETKTLLKNDINHLVDVVFPEKTREFWFKYRAAHNSLD